MPSAHAILAVLLVASSLAPAVVAGDLEARAHAELRGGLRPHPSIHVVGDGGFALPGSGVVAGSGTAEDPYVIRGWAIAQARGFALRLEGTRAHVLVEDVAVPRQASLALAQAECAATGVCGGSAAIDLADAQNVTVRRVRVEHEDWAIRVVDSADVRVSDVLAGVPDGNVLDVYGAAIVQRSRDVDLSRFAVGGAHVPFVVEDSVRVSLRASEVVAPPVEDYPMRITRSSDVRIEGNRFVNVSVAGIGLSRNLSYVRNEFLGPRATIDPNPDGSVDGLLLCGNLFKGSRAIAAVRYVHAANATFLGNRFEDNARGIVLSPAPNGVVERNLFTGHLFEAMTMNANPGRYEQNAFVGNGRGVFVGVNHSDLRHNWWGDPSGPSGMGNGTGDRLASGPGRVLQFDPWLTQMPDLSVDCGEAAAGPQAPAQPPAPLASARVEAVVRAFGQDVVRVGPQTLP